MWEMLIQKMIQQIILQSTHKMSPETLKNLKSLDGKFTVDVNKNGVPDFLDKEMDADLSGLAKGFSSSDKAELGRRLDHAFSSNGVQGGLNISDTVLKTPAPKSLVGERDIWDYLRIFLLIDVVIAFGGYVYFYLM